MMLVCCYARSCRPATGARKAPKYTPEGRFDLGFGLRRSSSCGCACKSIAAWPDPTSLCALTVFIICPAFSVAKYSAYLFANLSTLMPGHTMSLLLMSSTIMLWICVFLPSRSNYLNAQFTIQCSRVTCDWNTSAALSMKFSFHLPASL